MLVVGCKQSVDSGDPNWTTDEKEKKVWERDNSSNQYVRAFKQFGTSFSVTGSDSKPILAKIELADITTGKAGLVFGLNKLVIGGGVLVVLLSMLVVGCKQNQELSVEEHRKGESGYQHVWEAEYTGDNYYRSALQFGSGKMDIEYAKVRVKMNYPGNGKAGLLFATNEREVETTVGGNKEKKKVYDFYAFAFGKNPRTNNTLEAYVDYYVGLEKFNDTSSTSEKFGTGTNTPIVAEKDLENISWNGASPVTVDLIVEKKTTNSGSRSETVAYNLKIQDTQGNELWSATDVAATGEGVVNEGYLCSYGMVSKLANPKKVDTVWTLDKDSFKKTGVGTILAAEDAE